MYGTWYRSLRTKVWGRWLSTRTPHLSVRSQLLMKNDASLSALICSACAGKKQAARSQSKFTRCLRDEKLANLLQHWSHNMFFFHSPLTVSVHFSFCCKQITSHCCLSTSLWATQKVSGKHLWLLAKLIILFSAARNPQSVDVRPWAQPWAERAARAELGRRIKS